MIPESYEEWRECIEVRCKIRLTQAFVAERLAELQDRGHAKTRTFEELYGADHLARTVSWFSRAAQELAGAG